MTVERDNNEEGGVATKDRIKVKKPSLYKVLLHNDDYTSMEFVVYILKSVFGKSEGVANQITMNIHEKGTGICGVYTFEISETKQRRIMTEAKENGFPLLCTIEKE
ncbi:ATP-dependent Clp protease adaptor ClpS [bacterium]|nr:ATP-dependent Clp protease adaptor ClpS [bacterium]